MLCILHLLTLQHITTLLYMGNRLITAEDKDSIIDLLISKADDRMMAQLEYNEVEYMGITKGMYEIILKDMEDSGLFKRVGYAYFFELRAEIYRVKEYGGYTMERDAYIEGLKNIALQTEKIKNELSPSAMNRINQIIEKAKNITELTSSLLEIEQLLNRNR